MTLFQQWNIEELVPHSGPMVLIDAVTEYADTRICAEKTIKRDDMFLEGDQVPAWVAIEYMAQAIGAYAGIQAKLAGEPVKVGLLLGTRRLESDVTGFKVGEKITINAEEIHREDNGLCVFACTIDSPRGRITANLNVFVPENFEAYLSGDSNE